MTILDDVKIVCGIQPDYDAFDPILLLMIKSAVMSLRQLGVGPEDGVPITKDSTWDLITNDETLLDAVSTYIGCKVRMMFDPPTNGSVTEALKNTISELEFRLNVTGNHLKRKEG